MKHQNWQRDSRDERPDTNGEERLSADSDDAPLSVQAWRHQRQRTANNPLRRFANVFGVLAVFAFSFYLLAEYKGFGDLLKAKTNGLLNPAAPPVALPSINLDRPAPRQTADPYRIPQHFEPIKPDTLTNASISVPQPLADCIETANLIDEKVVACRYGTLPRDHRPAPSNRLLKNVGEAAETRQKQARKRSLRAVNEHSEPVFNAVSATQVVFQQPVSGMVSAQYPAQYKANQANRSSAPARPSASRDVDQVWIERWDGGGSYLAEWHSLNNRIDSSSVCLNHRRGSIDYRECRKAAKVHFREQCRDWEKRWARDRLEWSKQMEQRYCSAANGFSPMG